MGQPRPAAAHAAQVLGLDALGLLARMGVGVDTGTHLLVGELGAPVAPQALVLRVERVADGRVVEQRLDGNTLRRFPGAGPAA
jgi:hypothetical protein